MKQKINTLQNMCFDISQEKKYFALYSYNGLTNTILISLRPKTHIGSSEVIFQNVIELNEELPEQKLQETIDSLICYL